MSIETKHLIFTETEQKPKTKVWDVHNKHTQESLGRILWYGPWRQYCFDDGMFVYAGSCLTDIAKFLQDQMDSRKSKELGKVKE